MGRQTGAALLRLGEKPNDEAVPAPKLNIVTISKALGLLNCLGIVGANQSFKSNETPVTPDGISSVLWHLRYGAAKKPMARASSMKQPNA
jgi:hypothetical protein